MSKMLKFSLAAVLLAAGGEAAIAQSTYQIWEHNLTFTPFQHQTVEMAVATDRKSGQKMNVVKLKNGHMMVLVPADKYLALMAETPADDMVH